MNKAFFIQLLTRLAKDNPQFFKLIQFSAIALAALSAALGSIDTTHTALPSWLIWIEHQEVWIGSLVAAVMAQLPNRDMNEPPKK